MGAGGAERVSVIGDFNGWRASAAPLARIGDTGVWQGIVPEATVGHLYKYRIVSRHGGRVSEKADPYGFLHESPPATACRSSRASTTTERDAAWMRARGARQSLRSPTSVYEVHLGSWRRVSEDGFRSLRYREIAPSSPRTSRNWAFPTSS